MPLELLPFLLAGLPFGYLLSRVGEQRMPVGLLCPLLGLSVLAVAWFTDDKRAWMLITGMSVAMLVHSVVALVRRYVLSSTS